ncbi:MAG: phosphoribosyltransferase family protein [Armatimonadota bacterium]|nr:phosphoribosyltransferase family protein [Armatimonadota bacterium]
MAEIRIVSTESRAFEDRIEAGRALAEELSELRGSNPVILGIPRGAVPMAAIVAEELDGELDVVIVRKLRAPMNPEFAIGSMSEDGHALLHEDVVERLGVSDDYLDQEKREQRQRIQERKQTYRSVKPKVSLTGRIAVVVDDGFATGATMRAALASARREDPQRLIAAAPVGAQDTVHEIAEDADEVVCLRAPTFFGAVGAFYRRFDQVSDQQVVEVLREHAD